MILNSVVDSDGHFHIAIKGYQNTVLSVDVSNSAARNSAVTSSGKDYSLGTLNNGQIADQTNMAGEFDFSREVNSDVYGLSGIGAYATHLVGGGGRMHRITGNDEDGGDQSEDNDMDSMVDPEFLLINGDGGGGGYIPNSWSDELVNNVNQTVGQAIDTSGLGDQLSNFSVRVTDGSSVSTGSTNNSYNDGIKDLGNGRYQFPSGEVKTLTQYGETIRDSVVVTVNGVGYTKNDMVQGDKAPTSLLTNTYKEVPNVTGSDGKAVTYAYDSSGNMFWRQSSGDIIGIPSNHDTPSVNDIRVGQLLAGIMTGGKAAIFGMAQTGLMVIDGYGMLLNGGADGYTPLSNMTGNVTANDLLKGVVRNSPVGFMVDLGTGNEKAAGETLGGAATTFAIGTAIKIAGKVNFVGSADSNRVLKNQVGAVGDLSKTSKTSDIIEGTNNAGATGTVFDSIKATQPVYPGSAIPVSFEMTLPNGQSVWVAGNATEHMAEFAQMKAVNYTPEAVNLASQQQLTSLQAAVNTATQNGITFNQIINVGGWELKFAPARETGQLPALIHALRNK